MVTLGASMIGNFPKGKFFRELNLTYQQSRQPVALPWAMLLGIRMSGNVIHWPTNAAVRKSRAEKET